MKDEMNENSWVAHKNSVYNEDERYENEISCLIWFWNKFMSDKMINQTSKTKDKSFECAYNNLLIN